MLAFSLFTHSEVSKSNSEYSAALRNCYWMFRSWNVHTSWIA